MAETTRDDDVAFIEALARLLRQNDLTEIEVRRDYAEDDALRVRVSRGAVATAPAFAAPAPIEPARALAPPQPAPSALVRRRPSPPAPPAIRPRIRAP